MMIRNQPATELFDYTGIIHFHSEYSHDGRTPVSEILEAAAETRIDILMLTDHECLTAREKGQEGWHGKTLLIVGEEISPFRLNHLLVFGMDRSLGRDRYEDGYLQNLIEGVREKGGLALIAHPDHEGARVFHVKQFSWNRWDVTGYTGMSIWDFMTDWQSSLSSYWRGLVGYFFPAFVLKGPRSVTLERWDCLNQQSKIIGFGELDNHDSSVTVLGRTFSVFPFRNAFRFVRTHVLLREPFCGDKGKDIPAVLEAIRYGRAYVAFEYFSGAKGFFFSVSEGERKAFAGDAFNIESIASLEVKLPLEGKVRIIRNGEPYAERQARSLRMSLSEKGIYRIEAFLKRFGRYRPWIFSNPIYVK